MKINCKLIQLNHKYTVRIGISLLLYQCGHRPIGKLPLNQPRRLPILGGSEETPDQDRTSLRFPGSSSFLIFKLKNTSNLKLFENGDYRQSFNTKWSGLYVCLWESSFCHLMFLRSTTQKLQFDRSRSNQQDEDPAEEHSSHADLNPRS